MRWVVSLALVLSSSLAFAQAPPPPPPPPAGPAPAPAPAPAPPPPPGTYPAPAYPAPAPAPGQPGYYGSAAPTGFDLHKGMTFEANLGIGWIRESEDGQSATSDLGLGGLCLGVGGWLGPQTAITVRIAGVTLSDHGATLTQAFGGPSAQYWLSPNAWLGGGAGLSVLRLSGDNGSDSVNGFGLDLRAGYTFSTSSMSTFNASFELNPGFYSENGQSATFTGIAFLLGYQYL